MAKNQAKVKVGKSALRMDDIDEGDSEDNSHSLSVSKEQAESISITEESQKNKIDADKEFTLMDVKAEKGEITPKSDHPVQVPFTRSTKLV